MNKITIVASFALLVSSACAGTSATLVRQDSTGGRVALQGKYMPAMSQARELMVSHCAGRFDMQELGDAVEFRCQRVLAPESTAALAAREPAAQATLGL